ncbi:MAG TPA: hypothetical protein VLE97_00075 [Gaiellaceae bacterium]|nr:hypothetical protein [Gaiellaceae bacterium]
MRSTIHATTEIGRQKFVTATVRRYVAVTQGGVIKRSDRCQTLREYVRRERRAGRLLSRSVQIFDVSDTIGRYIEHVDEAERLYRLERDAQTRREEGDRRRRGEERVER